MKRLGIALALVFGVGCGDGSFDDFVESDGHSVQAASSQLKIINDTLTYPACDPNRPLSEYFCLDASKPTLVGQSLFHTVPITTWALYYSEFSAKGVNIEVDARWRAPYLGAGMMPVPGGYRMLVMGGTVRAPSLSADGYRAIVCHEYGHVLGGSPFQPSTPGLSAEGQADYFAAKECLARVFRSQGTADTALDARIEAAGYNMLSTLSAYDSDPSVIVRWGAAPPAVQATIVAQYPSLQCRYEQYRSRAKRVSCWFKM